MLPVKPVNQFLPQIKFAALPTVQTTQKGSAPKRVLILFSAFI
jgi:hypothetical protein